MSSFYIPSESTHLSSRDSYFCSFSATNMLDGRKWVGLSVSVKGIRQVNWLIVTTCQGRSVLRFVFHVNFRLVFYVVSAAVICSYYYYCYYLLCVVRVRSRLFLSHCSSQCMMFAVGSCKFAFEKEREIQGSAR